MKDIAEWSDTSMVNDADQISKHIIIDERSLNFAWAKFCDLIAERARIKHPQNSKTLIIYFPKKRFFLSRLQFYLVKPDQWQQDKREK